MVLGIFLSVISMVIFFGTRAAVIRQPFLILWRAVMVVLVVIVLGEFLKSAHLIGSIFVIVNLSAAAAGLSALGIILNIILGTRRRLENQLALNLVMLFQMMIGSSILLGVRLANPESIGGAATDVIYSVLAGAISVIIIGVVEFIFFERVNAFIKYSPLAVVGIFTSAFLSLAAWCLYYVSSPLISIFGILVTVPVGLYAYYRYFTESSFDRNAIINSMHLGWMILDQNNRIVDVNSFIEIITGQSAEKLKGKTVDDWMLKGNIFLQEQGFSQNSFQASINFNGFTYAFDVRSLSLQGSGDNLASRLLLWQDVTEQRKLEEARYRVLATKINLMRSISSAANHITDIEIFLEAAIFQIVSSFGCLAGFVFVRDSDFIGDDKASFRLEASYSYADLLDNDRVVQNFRDYFVNLSSDTRSLQIHDFQPGLFLEASGGSKLPGELLICPIMIDEHVQGAICLYRETGLVYDEDEGIGLEMIANELSMLIYVDHQRREAVSFSERKKLVKDLHDTVTQQLYGLLYQVEIAQAQSELGGVEHLPGALDKIGDTARQALREMRLFLHELRPVDLQNEGLVTALHHRLTAVEGRANIELRFISSETIEISLQQELNLYQIARETLNNVLRHSHAKKVVVNLKQNRNNICLEISDDGVGFDKSRIKNSGGMGVKNIRSWAAQIHAKLQIRSEPGCGTTIKVLVPRSG